MSPPAYREGPDPTMGSTGHIYLRLRQLANAIEKHDPRAELDAWLAADGGPLYRSLIRLCEDRLEALATYLNEDQVAEMARAGGCSWTPDQVRLLAVRFALASIVPGLMGLGAYPTSALLAARELIHAELTRREAEEGYLPDPELEDRILAGVYGAEVLDELARPVETWTKHLVRFCPPGGPDLVFELSPDELREPARPIAFAEGDPDPEVRERNLWRAQLLCPPTDENGKRGGSRRRAKPAAPPPPPAPAESPAARALSLLDDESTEADW